MPHKSEWYIFIHAVIAKKKNDIWLLLTLYEQNLVQCPSLSNATANPRAERSMPFSSRDANLHLVEW